VPIRAELRHHYGRVWRTVTRPRILARAGNCCEQCLKPDREVVETRFLAGRMWWRATSLPWINHRGQIQTPPRFYDAERFIRVVLTIAHLNHVAGDDRDENLKALCQWCHLNYDLAHHHETRAARKDAARPLLTPNQPTKEANL